AGFREFGSTCDGAVSGSGGNGRATARSWRPSVAARRLRIRVKPIRPSGPGRGPSRRAGRSTDLLAVRFALAGDGQLALLEQLFEMVNPFLFFGTDIFENNSQTDLFFSAELERLGIQLHLEAFDFEREFQHLLDVR